MLKKCLLFLMTYGKIAKDFENEKAMIVQNNSSELYFFQREGIGG